MNTSTRIHWIRVLIGGFLAEASVFALVIPVFMISGQHALLLRRTIGVSGNVFLIRFLGRATAEITLRLARDAGRSCCYASVRGSDSGSSEPFAYLLAHGLKILGGAGGGLVAARRRAATTATDVRAH